MGDPNLKPGEGHVDLDAVVLHLDDGDEAVLDLAEVGHLDLLLQQFVEGLEVLLPANGKGTGKVRYSKKGIDSFLAHLVMCCGETQSASMSAPLFEMPSM